MTCGIPQALRGTLPDERSVELVMLRHGSTESSERRAYAGWIDVPLSPRGEAEAQTVGAHLEPQLVYVSPLARARQTAQICFPSAQQVVRDDLQEMHFGAFEGRTADEMVDDSAYRAWVDGNCEGPIPGGESRAILVERTARALRGIVRETVARGENRAIIVAHGGTIMAAMEAFARTRRDYFSWQVEPCGGYRATARFIDGELSIEHEQRFSTNNFPALDEPPLAAHPAGASFFQNRACPHFPCHEGIATWDFNCLFCYCPLYALGPACGGNFTYTERGRKNCAGCTLPHQGENGAQLVAAHYEQLATLAQE
jgi:alpha-ribazole phosphatase